MAEKKPLTFFDPEQVDRPVPERPWRAVVFGALAVTGIATLGWEMYWRANWHEPDDFKNTSALWSEARRHATGERTALIGASRILFGSDLDVWERVSGGDRPIQLALEGTSPRMFLDDLANDEGFRGLVVVDYSSHNFLNRGGRRLDFLDYSRDESLSQRADHRLSKILERYFAFIDEQTRPKRMLFLAPFPQRDGMIPRVDPHKLSRMDADRNSEMWVRATDDPDYRNLATSIWKALNDRLRKRAQPGGDLDAPQRSRNFETALAEIKEDIGAIRRRGGDVAFVRFPFAGDYAELEAALYPREEFWDRLVSETQSAGVSFQDHAELQGYELPEWSHLSPREAERYTAALVPILYAEIERAAARRAAGGDDVAK